MIRRVLVAMDGSPHGDAAVALAMEWAHRFDAELLGLGILHEPAITRPEVVPPGAGAFRRHRDRVLLDEAHQRVLQFLAAFRGRCDHADVGCTVIEDVGRPFEQIVLEAQGCDLVVPGRQTDFHFETLSRVLRLSPRPVVPVVVVPPDPTPGEGMFVAYGGGREIARTLQAVVLLGLSGGETVGVLAVDVDRAKAEERLRRPGEFLAMRGTPHRLQPVVSEAAPAEVILEEVRRRGPRLLVMGGSRPPSRPEPLLHVGDAGGTQGDACAGGRRGVSRRRHVGPA